MTKLYMSFSYNLTKPDAKTVEFGVITLDGEEFVGFEWLVNLPALLEDMAEVEQTPREGWGMRVVEEMLSSFPEFVPHAVADWQGVKARQAKPSKFPRREYEDIVDYLCYAWHRSNNYVSRVVRDEE